MIRQIALGAVVSFCLAPAGWAADSDHAAPPGGATAAQPGMAGPQPDASGVAAAQSEAGAQPPPAGSGASFVDGITVEEMAALVREAGYRAEVKVGSDNLPYVSSRASGLSFWINLYGCEGEPARCWDIEFQSSLQTTPEQRAKAAQWAVDKVFGRVYSIEDSTYFAFPLRLGGGVTADNITSCIELWDSLLGDFTNYIDW
jgi:hypothetical protein